MKSTHNQILDAIDAVRLAYDNDKIKHNQYTGIEEFVKGSCTSLCYALHKKFKTGTWAGIWVFDNYINKDNHKELPDTIYQDGVMLRHVWYEYQGKLYDIYGVSSKAYVAKYMDKHCWFSDKNKFTLPKTDEMLEQFTTSIRVDWREIYKVIKDI